MRREDHRDPKGPPGHPAQDACLGGVGRNQVWTEGPEQRPDFLKRAQILEGANRNPETANCERLNPSGAQRFYVRSASSGQNERLVAVGEEGRGKVTHVDLRSPDGLRSGYNVGDPHTGRPVDSSGRRPLIPLDGYRFGRSRPF